MNAERKTPLILIVEDDEATGEVMVLTVQQETSYQARLVNTGREALRALQQGPEPPALLIMDYRLPDMTGVDLFDRLQQDVLYKDIPVLLMSATNRREEIEPRAVTMMDKPFDLDEFILTIESLVTSSVHHV